VYRLDYGVVRHGVKHAVFNIHFSENHMARPGSHGFCIVAQTFSENPVV